MTGRDKSPSASKVAVGKGRVMDEDTRAMIFEGCSVKQLATIFCFDVPKAQRLIGDLKPVGQRHGYHIYDLKSAAERMVHPIRAENLDEFIAKMNHADLPPLVKKEYWAGMRARQIYEMAAGDLWPTEAVISHMSELFKTISLTARLTADAVQRETSLSTVQRAIITRHMDEMLENLANRIASLCEQNMIPDLEAEKLNGRAKPAETADESEL